ncbi:unnamed protein product [Cuscuta campestris]|uniref:Plastocyanin-like domain-containing protein n=1 Tax=Cuscuta campestris TaxID=132261 RepID=A0A484K400_9ASTE|nr:unnamed protein product [Cuscuta campestris]
MQMKDQIGTCTYFLSTKLQRAVGGYGALNIGRRSVIPIPYAEPSANFTILVSDWWTTDHKVLRRLLDTGKPFPPPNGLLINGLPNNPVAFTANKGKTYMFRVSNIGMTTSINFRIQDHNLQLVEVEGAHTVQDVYDSFDIHVGQSVAFLDACGGKSCFRITNYKSLSGDSPKILIQGTTAIEITSGLHWYLKYWCGAHISWEKTGGIQIDSVPNPGLLPSVDTEGVLIQRPIPWHYYQNVVTSSYSYVWWDWQRWEKEIDWMALQGINMPLAFTGQEAIWQKVFLQQFNMTRQDLNGFFGGPAFLAWARMGNLHGWGGPLSQNWLDNQLSLQKLILKRMTELGMTPGMFHLT